MSVVVSEVGPRDGLQNEDLILDVAARAKLVDRLSSTGLPRIETVSFVHPDRVPQMSEAESVVNAIHPRPGTVYSGLVLNEKGYDRFSGCDALGQVNLALACTETFNLRNSNATIEASLVATERMIAHAHGDATRASVTLAVAFGCPFEGEVDPVRVLELAERILSAGADEIMFADTIGVAAPRQIRHLVGESLRLTEVVGVHLHNTRNTGYANAYAAVDAGATILDSSVGGLGGCPFAPRATGNIATEDLVYMLHREGVDTGVDLDALVDVSGWLEDMLGRGLPGQVYRAGRFPAKQMVGRS
jgi:isopropylmalate/homocitrate/citramalate synthase